MIERIIIENFKSIRKLDLELKPINILIGANGAGKSNFVSFFKLTNRIYEQRLQDYIGNNIDKLLHFGRKKSSFAFGLLNFDNKYVYHYRLEPALNGNSGKIQESALRFNHQNTKDYEKWLTVLGESGGFEESCVNPVGSIEDWEKNTFIEFSLEALKSFKIFHFHDTGSSSPFTRINNIDDNDSLREDGANLAAYLYYLQEKHPKDFKKIELTIRSVAPFFDRFNLAPRKLNSNEIILRWFEKGYDSYFDVYDLSDGTLRFMALTTLLTQPDLPKVIIIDEPELGLHPFAITKLAAMIQRAAKLGSQVIISTQSIEFLNHFEPEDIIVVDRKSDNYKHQQEESVFRRLNSEDLKDWLEIYSIGEIWEKNIIGGRP